MLIARDHRFARAAAAGVCAVLCALVAASTAGAHAFLIKSTPAPGSEVQSAPAAVTLVFTESVRPVESGIQVTRPGGHSVVAARPYVPASNPAEIVIPLQSGLGEGPYAVNWSEVDAADGHVISGAFVFSIGGGLPPIQTAASATVSGAGPPASALISRWLELAGVLVAAGAVGFGVAVRRAERIPLVVGLSLSVAAAGALLAVVLQSGEASTRFGHWSVAGACVAAVGAAAAAASRRVPVLWPVAAVLAVLLLGLPTATGHASAANVSRWVSVPADLLHLAAAALWLGGIVVLAVAVPRGDRAAAARRFGPAAIASVVLLGLTGVVRAYNELDSVRQVWSTGYGQALLVKTGVLAGVLALGWLNRRQLTHAGLAGELALLAIVIGAVAVLTNLRPGIDRASAIVAPSTDTGTVVFAGRVGSFAVGLAATPKDGSVELKTTVLGQNGPRNGLDVRSGVETPSEHTTSCGPGCYRATLPLLAPPHSLTTQVAGTTLRFAAPEQWPAPQALDIVRRAESEIRSLKTLVVRSHLASDATHAVTTIYRMVSPNRLAYHNVGGSDSIIIGDKRWDRQPGGRWIASPQLPPISQPTPFWPEQITDAHVMRTTKSTWEVSFLDPATPAWFTAWIDRTTYRTTRLEMVAAAHFMQDVDGPFNASISVTPPGR